MSGDILRKAVKDVDSAEWGWVTGRVVSFCNPGVTKFAEFGSGISARELDTVAGSEEVSGSNMMTNEMSKAPSYSIYTDHHIVTSVIDSEMIT